MSNSPSHSPHPLPWWHPERFAVKRAALRVRQKAMRAIRDYFGGEDFAEVETPILQISPGNETHLHAFRTRFRDPHGDRAAGQDFYLHTSPEFTMKKLLVAGEPRIFQFARVFRNAESSSRHHPEFTMLEWYRAGGSIKDIQQDCVQLVRAAATAADRKIFQAYGMACDPFAPWENLTVVDAFQRYCGIDLMAAIDDDRAPSAAPLAAAAKTQAIRVAEDDSWDDIFFRIMGEKIEPFLGKDRPTFLCDYPVSMAALSRPKSDNPRLAERFELYICGLELANAFGELTDAEEQLRRFTADMEMKERLYGERYPIDADFIAALRFGMPEACGIALGVDRLMMLCAGTEQIADVLWAPVAVKE